jgi:Zn-dependent protease
MSATTEADVIGPRACVGCGNPFPRAALSCPGCQRLVHSEALQALQAQAQRHAAAGDHENELIAWREALSLVPASSRQAQQIRLKIAERTAAAAPTRKPSALGKLAGLGALGLLLWKLKGVLALVLTKGKLLLLGLTKMSTLFSMLLSVGVYWTLWGWRFALGFVLSIYVHEMGHVLALRRLGIAATAPMFIPGLGAFIRAKQYPATPEEDADVGLAGPIWGLGAAVACWAVFLAWGFPLFAALAKFGAWVNLFNLLPVWQLDGGRGLRALDRKQRWIAAAVVGAVLLYTSEMMLLLILAAIVGRTLFEKAPERGHPRVLITYGGLIAALAWLSTLHVPIASP